MLAEERENYVQMIKQQLAKLPRRSKQWWRINRELLNRKAAMSSIPVLKMEGQWLSDAKEKADAFAQTFVVKGELPAEIVDTSYFGEPESEFKGFVAFRSRYTKRLFKKLDESKATGHDQISAVILRRLADCLAVPFTKVCRRLFFGACWPTIWKYHLIVPIFKKRFSFSARKLLQGSSHYYSVESS